MYQPFSQLLKLAIALMILGQCSLLFAAEPAPVTTLSTAQTAQTAPIKTIEKRLIDVERILASSGLLDMLDQLEELQQEVAILRGELEIIQHQFKGLQSKQRDIYADVDRRLQSLQAMRATTPQAADYVSPADDTAVVVQEEEDNSQPAVPTVAVEDDAIDATPADATVKHEISAVRIQAEYQKAFNFLKGSNYTQAIKTLKEFLQNYPKNEYSDNAQYWMAEALYTTGQYKEAIKGYNDLINLYPESPKVAPSLLKIGDSHKSIGELDKARLWYTEVKRRFPGSTAANLAEENLQNINNS